MRFGPHHLIPGVLRSLPALASNGRVTFQKTSSDPFSLHSASCYLASIICMSQHSKTSQASPNPQHIADLLNNHTADLSWQQAFYDDLHEHPELSHQEERTAAAIHAALQRFDVEVTTGIGGHGITAVMRNQATEETPTALMRADFDALFVDGNNMHACGHDMHTTALLGALAILDNLREHWAGTVIALFQPAEESSIGAKLMIEDDLIGKIPAPDVCLGQHVMPGRAGEVQTRRGPLMAGCDSIKVTIFGKSAHASMPHKSIDPTYTAAMIVTRLQAIVGREVAPDEFFVISVGTLRSGDTNNIIPDSAELVLNTRYYDEELAERVYAALKRVVQAEVDASGSTQEPVYHFYAHGEVVDNNDAVFNRVRRTFDATFGEQSVTAQRSTVSEDFTYLPKAWNVPYLFWFVGSTPRKLWDEAAERGTLDEDVPVNHQANFVPEYKPTVHATTLAGAGALLSFVAA